MIIRLARDLRLYLRFQDCQVVLFHELRSQRLAFSYAG